MANLTYEPAEALAQLVVGNFVEVLDRNGAVIGVQPVKLIEKLFVTTACGREWTREYGEWIGERRGQDIRSWPFPSIRKLRGRP